MEPCVPFEKGYRISDDGKMRLMCEISGEDIEINNVLYHDLHIAKVKGTFLRSGPILLLGFHGHQPSALEKRLIKMITNMIVNKSFTDVHVLNEHMEPQPISIFVANHYFNLVQINNFSSTCTMIKSRARLWYFPNLEIECDCVTCHPHGYPPTILCLKNIS